MPKKRPDCPSENVVAARLAEDDSSFTSDNMEVVGRRAISNTGEAWSEPDGMVSRRGHRMAGNRKQISMREAVVCHQSAH